MNQETAQQKFAEEYKASFAVRKPAPMVFAMPGNLHGIANIVTGQNNAVAIRPNKISGVVQTFGDFSIPVVENVPTTKSFDGAIVLNTGNNKAYVRSNGNWVVLN